MQIVRFQVQDFRNLRRVDQEFGPAVNVIIGRNAQGKTNLLEAMFMLVTGRSFRTRNERELVPWDKPDYVATVIRASVRNRLGTDRYLVSFNKQEKFISVNDIPLQRLGELIGRVNAVLFTPGDLELVQGAPAKRRRFLDMCLSQTSRTYLQALQRYELALRQRNALLRLHAQRSNLAREVAPFHEELATMGALIMTARREALDELSAVAQAYHSEIADDATKLVLRYRPNMAGDQCKREDAVRAALLTELEASLGEDCARGATSVGPHRDDFDFLIDTKDARDFASQGQQRTCVLALKLAELAWLSKKRGEFPILLLDDLMSELDESRRRRLLRALPSGAQTFITTTDRALVEIQSECRCYRISAGEIGIE